MVALMHVPPPSAAIEDLLERKARIESFLCRAHRVLCTRHHGAQGLAGTAGWAAVLAARRRQRRPPVTVQTSTLPYLCYALAQPGRSRSETAGAAHYCAGRQCG